MKIVIIGGAGNAGGVLALSSAEACHEIIVGQEIYNVLR